MFKEYFSRSLIKIVSALIILYMNNIFSNDDLNINSLEEKAYVKITLKSFEKHVLGRNSNMPAVWEFKDFAKRVAAKKVLHYLKNSSSLHSEEFLKINEYLQVCGKLRQGATSDFGLLPFNEKINKVLVSRDVIVDIFTNLPKNGLKASRQSKVSGLYSDTQVTLGRDVFSESSRGKSSRNLSNGLRGININEFKTKIATVIFKVSKKSTLKKAFNLKEYSRCKCTIM